MHVSIWHTDLVRGRRKFFVVNVEVTFDEAERGLIKEKNLYNHELAQFADEETTYIVELHDFLDKRFSLDFDSFPDAAKFEQLLVERFEGLAKLIDMASYAEPRLATVYKL